MVATISSPHRAARMIAGSERGVTVEIGGLPVVLETGDADFRALLERRYAGFVNPAATPACFLAIQLVPPSQLSDADVQVSAMGSTWRIERGDFYAEWDARSRCGWVRQSPNPYSIDTVLRIVHSLMLAEEGGLLLHAASVARGGRAFVFAGVSGAGKTTMARLAPADAIVLTDEISYVRKEGNGYCAYGTPFAGELARPGANLKMPFSALYFLAKGPDNHIEPVGQLASARALLRHILFFARDPGAVRRVFAAAVEMATHIPAARFVFTPDERAWRFVP